MLLDGASRVRIQGEEIEVHAAIRQFDFYSGHADASELVSWVKARAPVRHSVFLTHGEEEGLKGLQSRLAAAIHETEVILPLIDESYQLGATGSRQAKLNAPRRLKGESIGRLDWHNDLSKFLLEVSERVNAAADEKSRAKIIRRLRRALSQEE